MFSPKDFVPDSLKSRVVYQSTCASSGVRYIGETNRHFNTRVNEHLFRDKNSHIFKHLSASKGCSGKCDMTCFKILDHASTYTILKIKESFHIERLKPKLNKQVEHVSLSLHFLIYLYFFVISYLSLSFYWLVYISLTVNHYLNLLNFIVYE